MTLTLSPLSNASCGAPVAYALTERRDRGLFQRLLNLNVYPHFADGASGLADQSLGRYRPRGILFCEIYLNLARAARLWTFTEFA